jgi:dihydrofolate synthase/folylpolyglutamate synthase
MLDDKDVGGFIAPLTRHLTSVTAVPIEDEPRARSASDLVAALANLGRPARAAPTVTDAVSLLSRNRGPARVVVTGSHLLVGAALAANG